MRKITALLLGLVLALGLALPAFASGAGAYGVVTDDLGRPVAGAEVEVYRLGRGLVTLLTTDSHGGFRLEQAVENGSLWQLRVWAEGFRTAETGWFDLAQNRYRAVTLEHLTGTLQISVRDEKGLPLSGKVLVTDAAGRVQHEGWLHPGQWLSLDLVAGNYSVTLRAQGWAPTVKTAAVPAGQSATLLLMPGEVTGAPIGAVRARTVYTGLVLDDRGGPVKGATVTATGPDGTQLGTAESDVGGVYRIEAVNNRPGPVTILARLTGYVAVAGQAPDSDPSGNRTFVKDLVMLPSAGALSGRVINEEGVPRPGVKVDLLAEGRGVVASVTTDATGTYAFPAVALDGSGWVSARINPESGVSAGSLRHGTELVPMIPLMPGQETVLDLLIR